MNQLTDYFKVLSDETRLRMLIMLYNHKLCVCELTGIMNETQPKISKHLAKLRDMGIITDERQGQFIFYTFSDHHPLLISIIEGLISGQDGYPFIAQDLARVEKADNFLENMKCVKE